MKKFFLLFLLILEAACSTHKAPSTLRISFNVFPCTIDPRKSGDFASSTLICLIYEGLTRCLPDGSSEPAIAERVEISPDMRVYTFFLRRSVWSNGEPVTAFDFESSWKKIIDPDFPALCAYLFYPIKNCESVLKREKPISELGIHALDEYTLVVELERPTPYFLSLTAFPSFLPIPSKLAESDLDLMEYAVTNGPFRVAKMATNSEITLVKSESFWNRSKIHLDQIQIQIVFDETTALQMFERDELDWVGGAFSPIPTDAFESLKQKGNLHFFPMAATTFCTFNTDLFPMDCMKLRQAMSYAIDRNEIVEKIAQMGQLPATRCIPPSLMDGADKVLYPAHDPIQAKTLFKEAMEELKLSKFPSLTLLYRSAQIDALIAQTLQKQWRETLGIEINLLQTDFKTHKEKLHHRNYELSLSNWISQFNDPINILERFKMRENPKNYPSWENGQFIQLLGEAADESEPQKYRELIEEAEAIFAFEMPLAPIYHWSHPSLFHKRLKNIHTTPSGGVLFERCSISEENK